MKNKVDVKFELSKWGIRVDVLRLRYVDRIDTMKFDVLFHFQVGFFVPLARFTKKRSFVFSFDLLCFDKPKNEGARWQLK